MIGRLANDTLETMWQMRSLPSIKYHLTVISGFRCDVDEICALLGYYAALSGSSVWTFRDNPSIPSSRVIKSRNVGTELPLNAAKYPRRAQISSLLSYHLPGDEGKSRETLVTTSGIRFRVKAATFRI
jgi:hypothetical protein